MALARLTSQAGEVNAVMIEPAHSWGTRRGTCTYAGLSEHRMMSIC